LGYCGGIGIEEVKLNGLWILSCFEMKVSEIEGKIDGVVIAISSVSQNV
jgi:hypothetical protein